MKHVEITWLDAADRSDVKVDSLKQKGTKPFMVERTTYGILGHEDKDGIIIITDIDDDNCCELVVVPRSWVKKKVIIK